MQPHETPSRPSWEAWLRWAVIGVLVGVGTLAGSVAVPLGLFAVAGYPFAPELLVPAAVVLAMVAALLFAAMVRSCPRPAR